MKAKDLIKILEEDPEAEVLVTTDNFEQGHAKISLKENCICKWKMKKVLRKFRDAFDGGSYSSEIYEIDEKGKEVFVL